ncbi:hypothetical protein HAX54_036174, partial [Datura stramonium]|nr:hypothetical protein [Datura stramonium]
VWSTSWEEEDKGKGDEKNHVVSREKEEKIELERHTCAMAYVTRRQSQCRVRRDAPGYWCYEQRSAQGLLDCQRLQNPISIQAGIIKAKSTAIYTLI